MADEKKDARDQGEAHETVTTPESQAPQTQLRVDDAQAATYYSSTSRITGTGEEIVVDFSQGIRPSGQPNVALLKIDSRVILSPWAAKRLALALSQTIQRYEQTYGVLEIDPRRRQQGGGPAGSGAAAASGATTRAS